ncbi:hypothetical protein [Snuella lapsa]|uniref:EpsG family protein n=1 Tax=Snuella lapsa TaxID=870481 RepID=A0ABP6Y2K9_9FLAO
MNNKSLIVLLKLSAFFVFFGRGYEHLFWDAPFRTLLWDQNLLSPLVENIFGVKWEDYVTNLEADFTIQSIIKSVGVFYIVCSIASLLVNEKTNKFIRTVLFAGGVCLFFLTILQTKGRAYQSAMFFEHAIQVGSPFLLLYYHRINYKKLLVSIKVLVSLTFLSHGLYAMGDVYPLPGNFVTMTLNILPVVTESWAKQFLYVAGVIDVVVAIAVFFPKLTKYAFLYAVLWGLLTAFARIMSGLTYDISLSITHQYLYATLYRIPHGLIPFVGYVVVRLITREGFPRKTSLSKVYNRSEV